MNEREKGTKKRLGTGDSPDESVEDVTRLFNVQSRRGETFVDAPLRVIDGVGKATRHGG